MRWPAVLRADGDLPPEQQARLIESLFERRGSLIQGTVALLIAQALSALETGSAWYLAGVPATLLVLAARLRLAARYRARPDARSPGAWVRRFTAGGVCTALIWGCLSFSLMVWSRDATLQLVVIIVQVAWIAGLAVRNAGSGAAVLCQSIAAGGPLFCALLASGSPLLYAGALFLLFQVFINMGISRDLRGQTLAVLRSEQALAQANATLSLTCAELEDANVRLQLLSTTDELTRIGNRRAFEAVLQTEWARAARDGALLSLLLLDVDLFKPFNDRYGHVAGDDGLRLVAAIMQGALRRASDFVGRFGGEEFVILLPGVGIEGAVAVAERLRTDVLNAALAHEASPEGVLTVSIGVATAAPVPGETPRGLIGAADRALYRAKQFGRNRVERASELEHLPLPAAATA